MYGITMKDLMNERIEVANLKQTKEKLILEVENLNK